MLQHLPRALVIALPLALLVGCQAPSRRSLALQPAESEMIQTPLGSWLVAGPFPAPDRNSTYQRPTERPLAFEYDFLSTLGGEASAALQSDQRIPWTWSDLDQSGTATVAPYEAGPVVDLGSHFSDLPSTDFQLAYVYTEFESPLEQEALFLAGSDDGIRVWVNGELVHDNYIGRGYAPRQDVFPVNLRRGTNRVLAKVENGIGGWMVGIEVLTGEAGERELERLEFAKRVGALQNASLLPVGNRGYLISPGQFPELRWDDPAAVEAAIGEIPLAVQWFDGDLQPAERASVGRRYLAVATGTLPDGTPIRRGITVFCAPNEFNTLGADITARLGTFPSPVDAELWQENADALAFHAGELFLEGLLSRPLGAILLATLAEAPDWSESRTPRMLPDMLHLDKHLALKLQLDPASIQPRPLDPPRVLPNPSPVLREGSLEEAGFLPGTRERLDAISEEWARESGVPFVTLVARNGVIVTHDAFGNDLLGNPVPLDLRTQVASISKAVTGMMFARFLDQNYVALDDPIGHAVAGFPTEGPGAITYRMCFTHMIGTTGHWEWGRMRNPYFDNVMLNGLPAVQPGTVFRYNGMGFNLAGAAMERLSGKSIWRLFHEDFFHPLGIDEVPMEVLGSSARLTAFELAHFGQLLANRGSYGDRQFYSPEVHEQIIPQQLGQWYEGQDVEWGIGLTWMRDPIPDADPKAPLEERILFSPEMIGHGSATSCILRADPVHNLVVAQVRSKDGPRFNEFLQRYLVELRASMIVETD